jgi:lipoprotein NlpD
MIVVTRLKLICSIVILSFLSACSTTQQAPVIDRKPTQPQIETKQTTNQEKLGKNTHIVKPDDTLYSIGLEYGIDYKEIAIINGIPAPYQISIGQILNIPTSLSTDNTQAKQSENEATTVPFNEAGPIVAQPTQPDLTSNSQNNTGDLSSAVAINAPKLYREPYSEEVFNRTVMVPTFEKSINAPKDIKPNTAPEITTPEKPTIAPPVKTPSPTAMIENITWAWPHTGKLIGSFNEATNKGIDIAGKVGEPVKAAANGRVIYSGADLRGYGKMVIIKHNTWFLSVYAHNSYIAVKEGQEVKLGQKIAELGSTETSSPKLHFEIRRQGKSIDPMTYLPTR